MKFIETPLAGAYVLRPFPVRDERGLFSRFFCKNDFESIGFDRQIIQINHSITKQKGTIRGMHYQSPPASEIKIIRCIKGEIFDVMVDLRVGSQTFLQWHGVKLSRENMHMTYIPEGFAHGFQTLTDHTELIYLHSAPYSPEHERGLRYDDFALAIVWPLPPGVISAKDQGYSLINHNFKGLEI